MSAEITRSTVFAKINKASSSWTREKPYDVLVRDYRAVGTNGQSMCERSFETKEFAQIYVEEKGYFLVNTWKEARALTKELRLADSRKAEEKRRAIRGLTKVTIQTAPFLHKTFYLSPERAETMFDALSASADEFGRVID